MAPRKKPVPKTDSAPKPVSAQPVQKKPAGPKPKHYIAMKVELYHPFAKVRIPLGPPGVLLELPDSWLDSQIGVGLVKEL